MKHCVVARCSDARINRLTHNGGVCTITGKQGGVKVKRTPNIAVAVLLGALATFCGRPPLEPRPSETVRTDRAPAKVAVPETTTVARPKATGARGYEITDLSDEIFQKKISLTVKDADVEDVIRLLARQSGLNIVMNPAEVKGRVTVDLRDVSVGAALNAILRANGLELIGDPGGTSRIAPARRVRRNPGHEKIIVHVPLNWVSATDLKAILDPVVDGDIVADTLSNSLIIVDTPKKVEEIVNIIRGRDERKD